MDVTATTNGPLEIALAWSAVPQATGYTVKTATVSGGPYIGFTAPYNPADPRRFYRLLISR